MIITIPKRYRRETAANGIRQEENSDRIPEIKQGRPQKVGENFSPHDKARSRWKRVYYIWLLGKN